MKRLLVPLFLLIATLHFAMAQNVTSCLEIYDLQSRTHQVICEFPFLIEAPNWSPDGKWLLVNKEGRLYRIAPDGGSGLIPVDTGTITQCNNDHVITADGRWIGLSSNDPGNKGGYNSFVYIVPFEGGEPRRITAEGPSYLHGISPDGRWAAYCAFRGPEMEQDVYVIPVDGSGPEQRLTDAPGLDDGPEYSPDGAWIWFNSVRTGRMQVWKMRADGREQTQMTFETNRNSWFPHVSPDGKNVVYISYMDTEVEPGDHPANKHVQLRMIPSEGGTPEVLLDFFGGQGSLNVNSWNPGSTRFAFVSYRL
ncbi:MAG: PD40 domain-containing protein [Bacteroidales bacterium]|nr:PD40 domain-containing protein [Bacteroidales bacterium]